MKKKNLTDNQINMIYEMSDLHFKWFQLQQNNKKKYKDVLKLNHIKMLSIVHGCTDCTEDMIDFIFESIIRDYKQMLDNDIV